MFDLITTGSTYLFPGGRALKLVKNGVNITNATNPLILTKNIIPICHKKKKMNDDSGADNHLALLSSPQKKSDVLYIVGKANVNVSFLKS